MSANHVVTLQRKVLDDRTVVSRIKSGDITVHVKSVFVGTKSIGDVLFEIAKEQLSKPKY
jgi:hypothetical protein